MEVQKRTHIQLRPAGYAGLGKPYLFFLSAMKLQQDGTATCSKPKNLRIRAKRYAASAAGLRQREFSRSHFLWVLEVVPEIDLLVVTNRKQPAIHGHVCRDPP